MTFPDCLTVALGGAAGCVARYAMQQTPLLMADKTWPTMAVNILGCLLIGIVATLIDHREGPRTLRLLCVTGFLGGFTTYSTFMLDAGTLIRLGQGTKAAVYLLTTLAGGFAAFMAGYFGTVKLLERL